jgi:hypothetical protein
MYDINTVYYHKACYSNEDVYIHIIIAATSSHLIFTHAMPSTVNHVMHCAVQYSMLQYASESPRFADYTDCNYSLYVPLSVLKKAERIQNKDGWELRLDPQHKGERGETYLFFIHLQYTTVGISPVVGTPRRVVKSSSKQ